MCTRYPGDSLRQVHGSEYGYLDIGEGNTDSTIVKVRKVASKLWFFLLRSKYIAASNFLFF